MNIIVLVGFIAAMFELKTNYNGNLFITFTVAVNHYNSKTQTQEADFIKCIANGKNAEILNKFFTKGSPIAVEGTLRQNNYQDKNGVQHYSYQVQVNRVHFVGKKADNPATAVSVATATTPSTALPFPAPPTTASISPVAASVPPVIASTPPAAVTPVTVPVAPEQSTQSSPVLLEEQAVAGLHAILEECGDILDDEWVTL